MRNLVALGTALANGPHGHAQTEVLTRFYDNNGTGANLRKCSDEVILNGLPRFPPVESLPQ
jgi:hypothetical protein